MAAGNPAETDRTTVSTVTPEALSFMIEGLEQIKNTLASL
jgi:hypothetical protein